MFNTLMIQLILCRERLYRIQRVLSLHNGALPARTLTRSYHFYPWEVEQAAALGWVEIFVRKPHTGRPSRIVQTVSKSQCAKLPPCRWQIEKRISHRHWMFALHSVSCTKHGSNYFFRIPPIVEAYQKVYRRSTNRRGATASASRLLRSPGVRACRAWFGAQINYEISREERMPDTVRGIWQRLRELGSWRAAR